MLVISKTIIMNNYNYKNHEVPKKVQKLVDHATHLVEAYRYLSNHYSEIPGTYDGSTYYSYMNVKSIEVKNQFVYIKGDVGQNEYRFEKRYNCNKDDKGVGSYFTCGGLTDLINALRLIIKTYKKVLGFDVMPRIVKCDEDSLHCYSYDQCDVTGERVDDNWINTPGGHYIEWTTNGGVISAKRTEEAQRIIDVTMGNFSQGCWAVSAKGKKAYPKEFVFNSSERV